MAVNYYKTLSELISDTSKYDVTNVSYLAKTADNSLISIDTSVFEIYMRFIRDYIVSYSITDEQRDHYRCKPHKLSAEIYGTPELAWLIMKLNDQESPSKFRLKRIVYLIPPENLSEIYETIIAKSSGKLSDNWTSVLLDA